MSEKKGLFGSLFGGKKEKKGCCDMEIIEVEENDCCPNTKTDSKEKED